MANKAIETYEDGPISRHLPTIRGDSDASDRRMPRRQGNVPGIGRNSRDPNVRVVSSPPALPSDDAVSALTKQQTMKALHDRARERCSKARKWCR